MPIDATPTERAKKLTSRLPRRKTRSRVQDEHQTSLYNIQTQIPPRAARRHNPSLQAVRERGPLHTLEGNRLEARR